MTANDLLSSSFRMATQMLHLMCDDLTEAEFQHQPVPGTNSAAWIVGHLGVTARRMAERLGATDLPLLSEEFVARFSQTKQMASNQQELGTKTELLALFDHCQSQLIAAVKTVAPEALDGPAAGTGRFATNSAEAFLFGSLHAAMHCGQLSTIRRSLGKPPQV